MTDVARIIHLTLGAGGTVAQQPEHLGHQSDAAQTAIDSSAAAVAVVTTSEGALSVAPGGARAAIPLYIMQKFHEVRALMRKGDSIDPLPDAFNGRLYVELRYHEDYPDATQYALDGVKLWVTGLDFGF